MADFYGLELTGHPLTGHFNFIRNEGYIEIDGIKYGKGLYHHYFEAFKLLWPNDDWHRWRTLGLERICQEEINVFMGASDTGKTHIMAEFVLCDWWAHHPDCLWMVSSTELRGSELRIWGGIKHAFNKARDLHPWLPGTVLESKHCISGDDITDDGSMARLLTRGIIFVPCKKGDTWVGLGAYAGVKPTDCGRLGHAGDEVSFMSRAFLDAYANWYGKPKFKGLLAGNPTDIDDCLCIAAEPIGGWAGWQDTKKTQEWRSQWYNAWVIAYDGRDSPNFDPPIGIKPRYPYLIGPKKIEAVLKAEKTEDSPLYRSQAIGKPTPGQEKLKVITWQMCQAGRAFEDVIWAGTERIHIGALDAAYSGIGGDRCVVRHFEFGLDVEGYSIFFCHKPDIVPVKISPLPSVDRPEVQIAKFCAIYFTGLGVPAANFFFDARATMAVELARHWSIEVNAVDFGGPATDRPVSKDEFVWDGEENTKRLLLCVEKYSKFVTELWMSARYTILSSQMRGLDNETAEEGSKRIWHQTKGSPPRMEVETKQDMKKRTKQSPDNFDCLVTGLEGARRRGFQIENMRTGAESKPVIQDWLEMEMKKRRDFLKKREINYRA